MIDDYYTYLQSIKTYLSHHGRGVTFAIEFPSIQADSALVTTPQVSVSAQQGSTAPPSATAVPDGSPILPAELSDSDMPPSYLDEESPSWLDEELSPAEDEVSFGFAEDQEVPDHGEPDPTRPDVRSLDMSATTMEDLERFWSPCLACKLGSTRKNMVFGEGAVPARIFFIGEGPGANEDEQGRPFVGNAGQLLDRMISAMGLTRAQVYIGNIVKCRPPGNRDPEMDEMLSCMPVLKKQIELIQPEAIVTLGRIAAQALLATSLSLGKLRGRWHEYEGISLLPTYHPAYLLRNPAAKGKAWEDLQLVMKHLNLNPGA